MENIIDLWNKGINLIKRHPHVFKFYCLLIALIPLLMWIFYKLSIDVTADFFVSYFTIPGLLLGYISNNRKEREDKEKEYYFDTLTKLNEITTKGTNDLEDSFHILQFKKLISDFISRENTDKKEFKHLIDNIALNSSNDISKKSFVENYDKLYKLDDTVISSLKKSQSILFHISEDIIINKKFVENDKKLFFNKKVFAVVRKKLKSNDDWKSVKDYFVEKYAERYLFNSNKINNPYSLNKLKIFFDCDIDIYDDFDFKDTNSINVREFRNNVWCINTNFNFSSEEKLFEFFCYFLSKDDEVLDPYSSVFSNIIKNLNSIEYSILNDIDKRDQYYDYNIQKKVFAYRLKLFLESSLNKIYVAGNELDVKSIENIYLKTFNDENKVFITKSIEAQIKKEDEKIFDNIYSRISYNPRIYHHIVDLNADKIIEFKNFLIENSNYASYSKLISQSETKTYHSIDETKIEKIISENKFIIFIRKLFNEEKKVELIVIPKNEFNNLKSKKKPVNDRYHFRIGYEKYGDNYVIYDYCDNSRNEIATIVNSDEY